MASSSQHQGGPGRSIPLLLLVLRRIACASLAIGLTVGSVVIAHYFTILDDGRDIPWYRWLVSLAIYASLAHAVITGFAKRKQLVEQGDAEQPATTPGDRE